FVFAAGLRYTHIAQDYAAASLFANGSSRAIASGHNFNGAGPTIAIDSHARIGQSGFGLYGNARLAVLFGSGEQAPFAVNRNAAGVLPSQREAFANQSDVLPVGELELGVEFGRSFGDGRPRAFFQIGLVGHIYWGAGNASDTESLFTNGADSTSNLGFVGV